MTRWQWRRAAGWQGTPSHKQRGVRGAQGWEPPLPRPWGQPWGQKHLLPGARLSPVLEPRAPALGTQGSDSPGRPWRLRGLSPPDAFPNSRPSAESCLPLASSSKSSVVIFFFFINVIYKDGSNKKAEMRRLGGGGTWLRSSTPGVGLFEIHHVPPLACPSHKPKSSRSPHLFLSARDAQAGTSRRKGPHK